MQLEGRYPQSLADSAKSLLGKELIESPKASDPIRSRIFVQNLDEIVQRIDIRCRGLSCTHPTWPHVAQPTTIRIG
jgi:hypothetical protein